MGKDEIRGLKHAAEKRNITLDALTVSADYYEHLMDEVTLGMRAEKPEGFVLRLYGIEIRKRACKGCCAHG